MAWSIPGHNLDLSLGPLFLANCFNWALYGLLCLQVYLYYVSFPKDATKFKYLVYIVFLLDSASIGMATYNGYWVFVKNWGNVAVFNHLGWSWATVPASSGFIALVVQTFFAYRIWKISHNWWMPTFIIMLSTVACAFSFASAAEVAELQSFTYIRHLTPSIWLSFGISADFFVCSTLVYYLLNSRSESAFSMMTSRIIVRLVRIAVETALVTMIAATIKLYLIFSRKDNMHLLFCLLLSRLYTNAMLGTLNSRSTIFGGDQDINRNRRSGSRVWSSGPGSSFGSIRKPIQFPDEKIRITREVEIEVDCETGSISSSSMHFDDTKVPPEFPLSPRAPSYRTDPNPITPPPSAQAFLS